MIRKFNQIQVELTPILALAKEELTALEHAWNIIRP
jgi:hypothetical protein